MASHSLLFMEVDNTGIELQDSQQGIASNHGLNKTLENISGGSQTSSTSILRPQKLSILYNNQGVKSTTNTMVQKVGTVQLQNHSSKKIWECKGKCIESKRKLYAQCAQDQGHNTLTEWVWRYGVQSPSCSNITN